MRTNSGRTDSGGQLDRGEWTRYRCEVEKLQTK